MRKYILFTLIFLSLEFNGQLISDTANWKTGKFTMDWSQAGADTTVKLMFKRIYNVKKYGLRADNQFDNADKLRKLLYKARPYSTIYFPEGVYFFGSSIDIPSNVIIKGEGIDKTKFNFKTLKLGQRGAFNMASYQRLNPTELKKDIVKGDVTIFLESVDGYKKGSVINLFMENDSSLMYTKAKWNTSWGQLARGQILEVISINSVEKSLTLNTPVRLDYPMKDKPRVTRHEGYYNIGFEDFSIENFIDEDMIIFYFREARHCWINNIKSYNTVKHHVLLENSSKVSVLNSAFIGAFRFDGGGHGYGVACSNHTSDCLIENCAFKKLRHPLMTKKGANGNVFLNNYCFDGIWDHMDSGRPPATISIHGHYSYMNLFEGNITERITSADFWGPSGIGTSFIHNIITSDNLDARDYCHGHISAGNFVTAGKIYFTKDCYDMLTFDNAQLKSDSTARVVGNHHLYYKNIPSYFKNAGLTQWPITKNYKPGDVVLPWQVMWNESKKK